MEALILLAYEVAALGKETTAASLLEEALALAKQGESREDIARARCGTGHLALRRGEVEQARARFGESLEELVGLWTSAKLSARTKWIPASCLEGLGEIALSQGQAAWAVRLFGAGETLRVYGTGWNPIGVEQPYYEHTLTAARAQLGEEAFAALWAEGRAMTPAELPAVLERIFGSAQVDASPPGRPTTTSHPPTPHGLTAREVEALRLLAAGLTNQQIAERLVISPRTVNIHVASIYRKLVVTNRAAATRYAIDHDLI